MRRRPGVVGCGRRFARMGAFQTRSRRWDADGRRGDGGDHRTGCSLGIQSKAEYGLVGQSCGFPSLTWESAGRASLLGDVRQLECTGQDSPARRAGGPRAGSRLALACR